MLARGGVVESAPGAPIGAVLNRRDDQGALDANRGEVPTQELDTQDNAILTLGIKADAVQGRPTSVTATSTSTAVSNTAVMRRAQ